jgi:tetratricopeptide (TPR) repeat protein
VVAGVALWALSAGAGNDAPALETKSRMGVALAMSGQVSRAESVFVSLLSDSRGDARALNNLGNLRVVKGDLGVALAFYDRALRGDSSDAGIHLNRATVLMLMGDDQRAAEAAARGIRLAGGVEPAETLLGIRSEGEAGQSGRAAEKKYVSKDEVRAMLRRAASAVPASPAKGPPRDGAPATAQRKSPTWRSAGPRAADAGDAAVVLYWKH